MKLLSGFSLFITSLLVGFIFFSKSFNYEQQKRSMASVQGNYDLTCLSGEDFQKAVKNRIVNGFKTMRKDGYLGIYVGHFVFAGSEEDKKTFCGNTPDRRVSSEINPATTNKKLACREYPKMNLVFQADEEATAGHKREFTVETACEISSDLSKTETVWIPWEQLAHETPFEGEAQYNKPSKLAIRTSHISDQWPKKWILDRIELKGDRGSISVNQEEIRTIAGRPLVFEFK